tara:strand:- start:408 stop:602 length:195 start_codon:yes stop_codon:yes gene_type:complete
VSSGVITKNFIKEEKEFEILLQELYTLLVIYNIMDQNNIWEFPLIPDDRRMNGEKSHSYEKVVE